MKVVCYNKDCSEWQRGNICWIYSEPSPYKKGSEKGCGMYMPKDGLNSDTNVPETGAEVDCDGYGGD
jgi:hypothetical protein